MNRRVRSSGSTADKSDTAGFIKPQLATLISSAPFGNWLHEIKYDGYRVQLRTCLQSLPALSTFPVKQSRMGKWSSSMRDGQTFPDFRPSSPQANRTACAFDLLWRDGGLRKRPQIERKQMLADLLGENDIGLPIVYSDHLVGSGQEMFKHAAKRNSGGIDRLQES